MIFCAKFYFSAQMATMAIGNANPELLMITFIKIIALDQYKIERTACLLHCLLTESKPVTDTLI